MKKIGKLTAFLLVLLGFTFCSQAQIRELPEAVEQAFNHQYPQAQQAEYKDMLAFVMVYFFPDPSAPFADSLYSAKYSSNGIWKFTSVNMPFSGLPPEVSRGFAKSKYADWDITETQMVYFPEKLIRYKISVQKGFLKKRNLFFEKDGRLNSDNLTL